MSTDHDENPSTANENWKEVGGLMGGAEVFKNLIDALDEFDPANPTSSLTFLLRCANETFRTDAPGRDIKRSDHVIFALSWIISALIHESSAPDSLLESLREHLRSSCLPGLLQGAADREILLTKGIEEKPRARPEWAGADHCRCASHLSGERIFLDGGVAMIFEQDAKFLSLLSATRDFAPSFPDEGIDWSEDIEASCVGADGNPDLSLMALRLSQVTQILHGFLTWGDDSQPIRERFIRFLDECVAQRVHEVHDMFFSADEHDPTIRLVGLVELEEMRQAEAPPLSAMEIEATVWEEMRRLDEFEAKGWVLGEPPTGEAE